MEIQWWHWLALGLILVVVELMTAGGFYVIFFGMAAIVVGVLAGMHLAGPPGIQLLLFSVMSVVSLALFRNRLVARFQASPQAPPVDQLVGEACKVVTDIPAGGVGQVELRGSIWTARARSGGGLAPGTRCVVAKVDGLMVYVDPEGAPTWN